MNKDGSSSGRVRLARKNKWTQKQTPTNDAMTCLRTTSNVTLDDHEPRTSSFIASETTTVVGIFIASNTQ
jgi:hypothetical protein